MQEKQGVATHLLYQLYISLREKKKAQVRGIVQSTANAGLHKEEDDIYSDSVCAVYEWIFRLISQNTYYFFGEKLSWLSLRSSYIREWRVMLS